MDENIVKSEGFKTHYEAPQLQDVYSNSTEVNGDVWTSGLANFGMCFFNFQYCIIKLINDDK